ncbi:DUF11 domain-containing protein [Deinococcus petrolearius]|uniref:DUF11 domain-containing protein n=1 Tax=Deinococcus petrolearius TaxID=1751295 RepID=A0ABW1DMA7_9DEIO
MLRPPALRLTLLTGLLAGATPALAAGSPAGTAITNQATASYDAVTPGGDTRSDSNVVTTTVQAVCAVSVTPGGTVAAPGQSTDILPGERAVFRYTVTNAGNTAATLPLAARSETASAFAPGLALYADLNRNGGLDSGEPAIGGVDLAADASADVLLVADAGQGDRGDAFVNLVASCGGSQSSANVSRVRVGAPPVLNVTKTFTPALVRPGTETTVNVSAGNSGQSGSREVVLTDPLSDQLAQGLSFVPGSASADRGTLEYTTDGTTWSAQETQPVRGVRVRVPSLAPAETLTLKFRMLAAPGAEGRAIPNTATVQSRDLSASSTATADVRYLPGVALGPLDRPLAPEGTAEDTQTRAFAVVGQQVCFDHTVQNTGDVADNFRVVVTYPQGAAQATLLGPDGAALVQPLALVPGQTSAVRVCYTPAQTGPLEALLTVRGERGTGNTTRDLVSAIETGLPELRKSVTATSADGTALAAGATVAVGDRLSYTLTVRNPYARPLTGVVVSDPLPAHVDALGVSGGGTLSGAAGTQVAEWRLGTLAPGESRTLKVEAVVSSRAVDGEALTNVFNLVTTELPTPLPSNAVATPVWSAQLLIAKTVSARTVTYGDRLTYTLRIRNASATTAVVDAVVTDTPARGLLYLPGTATLDGQPLADPVATDGQLSWTVASIPAGGEVVITYAIRVTPEAGSELDNVVQVVGTGAGGAARAIASNNAKATVRLDPLKFAPVSDVLGVVYVDRNRNGRYDAGLDTPIERARVVLAGGRLALTDAAGRYHFANVGFGTQALRLDPSTVPYPPLAVPGDGGLSGTRTVQVRGLTGVDFPLAPLGGEAGALRRTTLQIGDVQIDKVVTAVPGGYAVALTLRTPRALPDFRLEDPLPGGAALKEGRNTLSTTLGAGETKLTYRFDWTGEARAATTDPVVSWRY